MPAKAFSAPGPYCIAKTPGGLPLVTRAQPSAMCTPTRSWRQITGRMPPATAASMIGVVGNENRVEMPSRFRISVIASMTSIGVLSPNNGSATEPNALPGIAPAHAPQIRHPERTAHPAQRLGGSRDPLVNRLVARRVGPGFRRDADRGGGLIAACGCPTLRNSPHLKDNPREDRAHRKLHLRHQELEGSLVLPGRDR